MNQRDDVVQLEIVERMIAHCARGFRRQTAAPVS